MTAFSPRAPPPVSEPPSPEQQSHPDRASASSPDHHRPSSIPMRKSLPVAIPLLTFCGIGMAGLEWPVLRRASIGLVLNGLPLDKHQGVRLCHRRIAPRHPAGENRLGSNASRKSLRRPTGTIRSVSDNGPLVANIALGCFIIVPMRKLRPCFNSHFTFGGRGAGFSRDLADRPSTPVHSARQSYFRHDPGRDSNWPTFLSQTAAIFRADCL